MAGRSATLTQVFRDFTQSLEISERVVPQVGPQLLSLHNFQLALLINHPIIRHCTDWAADTTVKQTINKHSSELFEAESRNFLLNKVADYMACTTTVWTEKWFLSSQTTGKRKLSPGAKSGHRMELTTQLHLAPQWRKCGTSSVLLMSSQPTGETSKQSKSTDNIQEQVEKQTLSAQKFCPSILHSF